VDFDEMRAAHERAIRHETKDEKIARLEERIADLEAEVRRLERLAVC